MARVRGGGTCRASAARRGRGRPPGSGRREHDAENPEVATMAARRGRGRPPGSRSREHDAEQPSQHILQPVQSIPESSSQHIPEHVLQPHQSHEAHIPAQAPAGRQSNIHIFTDPPQPNRGSNVRPRSPSVETCERIAQILGDVLRRQGSVAPDAELYDSIRQAYELACSVSETVESRNQRRRTETAGTSSTQ